MRVENYTIRHGDAQSAASRSRERRKANWPGRTFATGKHLVRISGERLAKHRKPSLGQCHGAKEQGGVKRVTRQGVPEQRNARNVTCGQAARRFWKRADRRGPQREVGDEKKLNRARQCGCCDSRRGPLSAQPKPNRHTHQKACIDERNQLVEPRNHITKDERQQRNGERLSLAGKISAAEKRQCADGREIHRMRSETKPCRGENDSCDHKRASVEQISFSLFFCMRVSLHSGNKSQNQNPSRNTFSPAANR